MNGNSFRILRARAGFRPLCRAAAGLAFLLLLLTPLSASAFRLEAEAFESSCADGGEQIGRVDCEAASGGEAVEGFDWAEDCIRIPFSLAESMFLLDSLRTARELNTTPASIRLEILTRLDESVVASDLLVTGIGLGIGWLESDPTYDWVQSSEPHEIDPGQYWLQITKVGKGRVRLDCVELYQIDTPVEETTWGRVKSLFAR